LFLFPKVYTGNLINRLHDFYGESAFEEAKENFDGLTLIIVYSTVSMIIQGDGRWCWWLAADLRGRRGS
jgi:hypothetical protein